MRLMLFGLVRLARNTVEQKTTEVRKIKYANSIAKKTLEIIRYLNCEYWFIENPETGLLKKQGFI